MNIISLLEQIDVKRSVERFVAQTKDKYGIDRLYMHVRDYENTIVLDDIVIPKDKRKQGIGSSIMNEIINFADGMGKIVMLTPAIKSDYHGTTSRGRLVKFYKRFGFVPNKGRNKDFTLPADSMYRTPK